MTTPFWYALHNRGLIMRVKMGLNAMMPVQARGGIGITSVHSTIVTCTSFYERDTDSALSASLLFIC